MSFVNLKDNKEFEDFLVWYATKEEYKWVPIMVADRVNVLNQKDELIAYKTFGIIEGKPVDLFCVKEDLCAEYSK